MIGLENSSEIFWGHSIYKYLFIIVRWNEYEEHYIMESQVFPT